MRKSLKAHPDGSELLSAAYRGQSIQPQVHRPVLTDDDIVVFEERSFPSSYTLTRPPIRFPAWVEKLAEEARPRSQQTSSESIIHEDRPVDPSPPKVTAQQSSHQSPQDPSHDRERSSSASAEIPQPTCRVEAQTPTSPMIKRALPSTSIKNTKIRHTFDKTSRPSTVNTTQSSQPLITTPKPPSKLAEDDTQRLAGDVTGHSSRSQRIAKFKRVLDTSSRINKIASNTNFR